MKIGILTFHWTTNYGGVLQAYALQSFLLKKGYDVEIINYAPKTLKDSFWLCFKTKSLKSLINNIGEYKKEMKFRKFKLNRFKMSKRYFNIKEVDYELHNYSIVISGSDQVWNPHTALNSGLVYFQPTKGDYRKIAYAVSLGCTSYPQDILTALKAYIDDFDVISVREESAIQIIQSCVKNKTVELMPDPTLFLDGNDIRELCLKRNVNKSNCFFYILHKNQRNIYLIKKYLSSKFNVIDAHKGIFNDMTIEEWLLSIQQSNFVVTNSFHGVIFSILSHTDFIVVPVEGAYNGMNDRISTLLSYLSLTNRIIDVYDEVKIERLKNEPINWIAVDKIVLKLRETGSNFLLKHIVLNNF